MTVKKIAKWAFHLFLAASVSMLILDILSATGADKYWYYRCGAGYVGIYLILDRATRKWREE
jgi:hypothetical protein